MGKVKQLWEAEREKALEENKKMYVRQGYSEIEAEEMAANDLEEEDAANGQFGVGA